MEDVEYRPQRGIGTPAMLRACFSIAVAAILLSLGFQSRAAVYLAAFPAALAVAWFAGYAVQRRYRTRLMATGIETRRLRTRFIPWTQIRDIQVVKRVTVAQVRVRGNRSAGRFGSRSGGGARKVASIRVQQANGRWRELPMPVARENAPDTEFTDKSNVIRDRWQAAARKPAAVDGAAPSGASGHGGHRPAKPR